MSLLCWSSLQVPQLLLLLAMAVATTSALSCLSCPDADDTSPSCVSTCSGANDVCKYSSPYTEPTGEVNVRGCDSSISPGSSLSCRKAGSGGSETYDCFCNSNNCNNQVSTGTDPSRPPDTIWCYTCLDVKTKCSSKCPLPATGKKYVCYQKSLAAGNVTDRKCLEVNDTLKADCHWGLGANGKRVKNEYECLCESSKCNSDIAKPGPKTPNDAPDPGPSKASEVGSRVEPLLMLGMAVVAILGIRLDLNLDPRLGMEHRSNSADLT